MKVCVKGGRRKERGGYRELGELWGSSAKQWHRGTRLRKRTVRRNQVGSQTSYESLVERRSSRAQAGAEHLQAAGSCVSASAEAGSGWHSIKAVNASREARRHESRRTNETGGKSEAASSIGLPLGGDASRVYISASRGERECVGCARWREEDWFLGDAALQWRGLNAGTLTQSTNRKGDSLI